MGIGQKFLNAAIAWFELLDYRVHFDAVAGRQEHPFLNALIRAEPGQRLSEPAFRNRQLFPYFDRCGLVTESDNDNMHRT